MKIFEEAAEFLEDIADAADWKGQTGARLGFTRIRSNQGERMRAVAVALRQCGTDGFRNNVLDHSLSENEKVQADIWNRRATQWIPASERLPERGDTVLAYIRHNYCDDGWRAYRTYEYTDHWVAMGNLCEVIAWQPLPEPPEEKERESNETR